MSIKNIRINEGTVVITLLMLIAAAGLAAYFLFIAPQPQQPARADEKETPTKLNPTLGTPQEIKSDQDLDKATNDLDQTSMDDATDLNQLDQETSGL